MKKFLLAFFLGILSIAAIAQSDPKFSYQSVVRDTNNHLVTNCSNITLKWEVLDASNNVIYSETHTGLSTNANGLLSIQLGDSTIGIGQFWSIDWTNARAKTTITFNNQTIVSPAEKIYAVPYSLMSDNWTPTVRP